MLKIFAMHLIKTMAWMSQVWLPETAKICGYTLGASGGHLKIALGAWPFLKNEAPEDIVAEIFAALMRASKADLKESPLANTDPLGYSLYDHPILDADYEETIVKILMRYNLLNTLHSIKYNIVFLDLIKDTLLIQAETCQNNGINGIKKEDKIRESVCKRLLHQRYHLFADKYADQEDYLWIKEQNNSNYNAYSDPAHDFSSAIQSFLSKRHSALARSIRLGKKPYSVLDTSWSNPYVHERDATHRTHGSLLKNLGNTSRLARYLSMSELLSLSDENPLNNVQSQDVVADTKKHASFEKQEKRKRNFRGKIVSVVEQAYRPGLGVMLELWNDATLEAPSHSGAAVVAGMISSGIDPLHWRNAEIINEQNCSLIGTHMTHATSDEFVDKNLHIPTDDIFWRFAPAGVGKSILIYRELTTEFVLRQAEIWLQDRIDRMTVSRLRDTLLWRFPLEVNVQSIYWRLGLDADAPPCGDRSYVTWQPYNTITSMLKYYRLLDPNFKTIHHEVTACGSPFTPLPDVVKSFFQKQKEYIDNIPEILDSSELIVKRANVIATVARFAEALLSFTRNRDAFFPIQICCNEGRYFSTERFRIVVEKEWERIVVFSEVLRQHVCIVRAALDQHLNLLRRQGLSVTSNEEITMGIYFIGLHDGVVSLHSPTRHRMLNALEACEETNCFIGLHRNAARHAGNTYLRALGYPESKILLLMDHFAARARSPLSIFSMRVPVPSDSAQAAGKMLAERLGILH